jgi:hypothetical protein
MRLPSLARSPTPAYEHSPQQAKVTSTAALNSTMTILLITLPHSTLTDPRLRHVIAHLPVLHAPVGGAQVAPPRGPGCLPRAGTVRYRCRQVVRQHIRPRPGLICGQDLSLHLHIPRARPTRGGDDDFGQAAHDVQGIARLNAINRLRHPVAQKADNMSAPLRREFHNYCLFSQHLCHVPKPNQAIRTPRRDEVSVR